MKCKICGSTEGSMYEYDDETMECSECIRIERDNLRARLSACEAECERLQSEYRIPKEFTPHSDPDECPSYHDHCHCTPEAFADLWKQLDTAEEEIERLREIIVSTKEIYRGDPNLKDGEEETILSADTGKVFIRQMADGGYLLGVDKNPDPEKWCRSVITLTELQRKKLIGFLSFSDA